MATTKWVEGEAEREAQFQHQLRLEHLGAGLSELSFTVTKHPHLGDLYNYYYTSGSTMRSIPKEQWVALRDAAGAQRTSFGTNGAGQYFEVWEAK